MPARRPKGKKGAQICAKKKKIFFVIEDRRSFSFLFLSETIALHFFFRSPQSSDGKKPSLSYILFFFFGKSNLERKKGGHSLDFPLFSTTAPRIHWAGPLLREASSSFTLILLDHSLTLSFPPPSPTAASKLMKQKKRFFFFSPRRVCGEKGPSLFASLYFPCSVRPFSSLSTVGGRGGGGGGARGDYRKASPAKEDEKTREKIMHI